MPTTTANEIRAAARQYTVGWLDRFSDRFEHYVMHRFGTKDYGFIHKEEGGCVQRYRCSYPEAQRRFKVWWVTQTITRRLTT